MIIGNDLPWKTEEYKFQWIEYTKQRYSKNGLSLPIVIEIAVIVNLAQLFLKEGLPEKYGEYMHVAICDAAGWKELQSFLQDRIKKRAETGYQELCETARKDLA
ncbi:MAG: hypothetical protein JW881_16165 [Spirochaetales bacterium]|nr:hypothetical protein [Spirochaetales bacterium]